MNTSGSRGSGESLDPSISRPRTPTDPKSCLAGGGHPWEGAGECVGLWYGFGGHSLWCNVGQVPLSHLRSIRQMGLMFSTS